ALGRCALGGGRRFELAHPRGGRDRRAGAGGALPAGAPHLHRGAHRRGPGDVRAHVADRLRRGDGEAVREPPGGPLRAVPEVSAVGEDGELLARSFEEHRAHLKAVAYRMLGSLAEAEDAVQEAWLRLGRAEPGEIDNLGGWLTTVTGRICLDLLRPRTARREQPMDDTFVPDPVIRPLSRVDPEQEALEADSVGIALLVVMENLDPDERLAFV